MAFQIRRLWTEKKPGVDAPNRVASPVAINSAESLIIAGNIITERGIEAVVWKLKGDELLPSRIPNGSFVDQSLTITGLADPDGFATHGVVVGHGRTVDDMFRVFNYRLRVGRTQNSRVVYSDEGPNELPTLIRQATGPEGELVSIGSAQAFAIASTGTALSYVAGQSDTANGTQRAAFWLSAAIAMDLGTLGGNASWATAVTGGGDVAGWSQLASGVTHATYFRRFGGYVPTMVDLGTLGGLNSAVTAAASGPGPNPPLFLAGYADDSAQVSRACRFSRSESTHAIMIPGAAQGPGLALAVNSAGTCVGRIELAGRETAFIHTLPTPGGQSKPLVDLNTLISNRPFGELSDGSLRRSSPKRFHLSEARAINSRGEIVAVGTIGDTPAAFVLVPTKK